MRCATQTGPDQTDLGRARGVNCDRLTESGSTIYSLDCLIRTPSRVCTVWSGHYLRSGQSDQSRSQSLDSLTTTWSRVWQVLGYDLHSLNRALSRVSRVWSETFPESGKFDHDQELQRQPQSLYSQVGARPKSVWSEPILVWMDWSELAWVATLILGSAVHSAPWNICQSMQSHDIK